MKILPTSAVKEADKYTIDNEPIASIDLMERAASRAAEWIVENIGLEHNFIIFAGPGNNGGDGLVIARLLSKKMQESKIDKRVSVFIVRFTNKFSADFKVNLSRLEETSVEIRYLTEENPQFELAENDVIIDAIFGSGLSRPVGGFAAKVIEKLNDSSKKYVIAIDIPSGLFGEENHTQQQVIVKATHTLTFEFPFLSFFFAENQDFVGEFHVIPIGIHPQYIEQAKTDFFTVEAKDIARLIKPRKRFSHKGHYGHGLLVAGSFGRAGAAILAAKAAHRAGIGLLTVHLPAKSVTAMQAASPETMVSVDQVSQTHSAYVDDLEKYTAIGFGPAVGLEREPALLLDNIMSKSKGKPMVLDADALTIIGQHKWLDNVPAKTVLTPHPKEFERIAGQSANDYQRLMLQQSLAKERNLVIVLKGAYTSICLPDGRCFFNTTGNQGLATGGSGDVLTGIILSLLAQGYTPENAALTGVFLHGLAADIAVEDYGYQSLLPSDVVNYLPDAYAYLEQIRD